MVRRRRLPRSIRVPPGWYRGGSGLLIAALVVIVGLVCARSTPDQTGQDDWTRYHDRSFRVVHVVDGDTLDIDAPDGDKAVTRIRLWGVDTPELAHAGEPAMHFSEEARAFAAGVLTDRRVHVVLSAKRTRDKYGRLLAYVFLERGGSMFNEMLLEEGYAYADLRFEHHYFDRFGEIEKQARGRGAGLWANVTPDQMPPWKQRFEHQPAARGD